LLGSGGPHFLVWCFLGRQGIREALGRLKIDSSSTAAATAAVFYCASPVSFRYNGPLIWYVVEY
jgi:hypothetical protein